MTTATLSMLGAVGLSTSLQATSLPVAVTAAGMWIAYSVDGGLYDHGMEYEGGIEQL
jgi:hypothetical protein